MAKLRVTEDISLTTKLRKLYSFQNTLPKVLEVASVSTQYIETDYVTPRMFIIGHGGISDKLPVELGNIFSANKDDPEAGKILIIGDVGSGKTTIFSQKLPNGWGNREELSEKFDYIFKIKLKHLFGNWRQNGYSADDLDEPLKCFIHYLLREEIASAGLSKEYKVKKDEVFEAINLDNRDRILLSIDGYDDVAEQLAHRDVDPIIKNIMDEIFKFKYITMIFRSDSIPPLLRNKFERKIEVIGYDFDGVESYANKYFVNQKKALQEEVAKFFEKSPEEHEKLVDYFSQQTDPVIYEMSIQLHKINAIYPWQENNEEIKGYINLYYQSSQEILSTLLEDSAVRELTVSPINTAMLCLVCSDLNIGRRLIKDFTIGRLYQELVIWLSRRYLSNSHAHVEEITAEMIFNSKEFKILKAVAYEGASHDDVIEGSTIEGIAVSLGAGIREVYQFGLLKLIGSTKDVEGDNLLGYSYSFNRLSVQAYLAACSLKEKLTSSNVAIFREAAQFIADHRNETKYLAMLKFLIEMMARESTDNIDAITRFWEAVACNVDGVLELGVGKKITLLMHLVTQSKINNEIDSRIPILQQMVDFIDTIILKDFLKWGEAIKASGYLSDKIQAFIWQEFYTNGHEAIIFMDIVGAVIGKLDNSMLLEKLSIILQSNADWQVRKSSIKLLIKLIKKAKKELSSAQIKDLAIKIMPLIEEENLSDLTIKALAMLIEIDDKKDPQVLVSLILDEILLHNSDSIIKLVVKISANNNVIANLVLDKLKFVISEDFNPRNWDKVIQIIVNIGINNEDIILNSVLYLLMESLKQPTIAPGAAYAIDGIINKSEVKLIDLVLTTLTPMLVDESLKLYIIAIINNISKHGIKTEVVMAILEMLFPILIEGEFVEEIVSAISNIIEFTTEINPEMRRRVLDEFIKVSHYSDNIYNSIASIAVSEDLESLEKAFNILEPFLAHERLCYSISNAIGKMTAFEMPSELANRLLTKLIDRLISVATSNDTRLMLAIPISNLMAKYVTNFETINIVADHLISLLENQLFNSNLRIMDAIHRCGAGGNEIKTLFFEKLHVRLINSPIENQDILVQGMSRLGYGLDSSITSNALEILIERLNNKQVSKKDERAISHAIGNLVGKDSNLANKALGTLISLAKQEIAISSCAIYSIGKIIKKVSFNEFFDNERANELLNNLASLLSSKNPEIRSSTVYAISKIMKREEVIFQEAEEVLEKLIIFLGNEDQKTHKNIAYVIGKITETMTVKASLIKIALEKLISVLNIKSSHEVVAEAMIKIMKRNPLSHSIELLSHSNQQVREVVIEFIPMQMIEERLWEETVENMLYILAQDYYDMDLEQKKKLHEDAKRILYDQIKVISEQSLSWVNENFSRLIRITAEAISVMEAIYHHALSDYEITKIESRFILKCIAELGFTNIITSPIINKNGEKEFTILFANKNYRFVGEKNLKYLEVIASTALFGSADPLAEQYITNEPLFTNTELGIRKAASDKKCISLVDGTILSTQFWRVSILYDSDHHQSNPKDVVILLERSVLGRYRLDEVFIKDGEINNFKVVRHPDDIDNALRVRVFGEMKYIEVIPRYFGKTFDLYHSFGNSLLSTIDSDKFSLEQGSKLFSVSSKALSFSGFGMQRLNNLIEERVITEENSLSFDEKEQDVIDIRVRSTSDIYIFGKGVTQAYSISSPQKSRGQSTDYKQLVEFFYSFIKKAINKKLPNSRAVAQAEVIDNNLLTGNWEVDRNKVNMFSREMLLKIHDPRESFRIESEDRVKTLGSYIAEVKSDMGAVKLNVEEIKTQLKNIDFKVLESVVDKEKLKQDAKREFEIIELDPYKFAFYQALRWQLNGVYIASSAISSQMVKDISEGTVGKIGGFLKTISAHTPLVGIGVYLVGEIFSGVGKFQQDINIENFVHLVGDSIEMTKLAEKIARHLALSQLQIIDNKSNTDMLKAAVDMTQKITQITVSSIVASACKEFYNRVDATQGEGDQPIGLKEYATRFMEGPNKDDPQRRGEADAAIIAKLIIKNIFAGEYSSKRLSIQNKALAIIKSVNEQMADNGSSAVAVVPTTSSSRCTGGNCIIMRVETSSGYINPILNHPLFSEIYKFTAKKGYLNKFIDLGENAQNYQKFIREAESGEIEKVITKFIENDELFTDFLSAAETYLSDIDMRRLEILGEDIDIAEQILLTVEAQGVEKVLDTIFDINKKKVEMLVGQEKELLESIEQFEKIIGKKELNEQVGFSQYITNALYNNFFSASAREVIKSAANLAKHIEHLLDYKDWYIQAYGIDVGDRVMAAFAQLDGLLEFARSGQRGMLPFYRPPYFDPDGDFGGGSSGGGHGNNKADNSTQLNFLTFSFNGTDTNYTYYE